jgi:hypothetical protein
VPPPRRSLEKNRGAPNGEASLTALAGRQAAIGKLIRGLDRRSGKPATAGRGSGNAALRLKRKGRTQIAPDLSRAIDQVKLTNLRSALVAELCARLEFVLAVRTFRRRL